MVCCTESGRRPGDAARRRGQLKQAADLLETADLGVIVSDDPTLL